MKKVPIKDLNLQMSKNGQKKTNRNKKFRGNAKKQNEKRSLRAKVYHRMSRQEKLTSRPPAPARVVRRGAQPRTKKAARITS